MADPQPAVPTATAGPQFLAVLLLATYVLADAALWLLGAYHLFLGIPHLPQAGGFLTLALLLLLFAGWVWRWLVAMGWIGGRPTARFGGA